MSLEPAIAAIIGFTVLDQVPRTGAVAGIVLVVAAGIGAERTGRRLDVPDGVSITAPIHALNHGTQP
jgi:inner membrane transporter RhtA